MSNNRTRVTESNRDWSDLHEDLLILIAKKLKYIECILSFRSVCISWRSASNTEYCLNETRQFPWILLHKRSVIHTRDMVDFAHARRYETTKFPHKVKSHHLGWKGWVVVVMVLGDMSLFHAFKRTKTIKLPNLYELGDKYVNVNRVVLSSDPFTNPTEYTLALVYCEQSTRRLAIWRPGDKTYTKIDVYHYYDVKDAIFHGGLLYLVTDYYINGFDIARLTPMISYSYAYAVSKNILSYVGRQDYLVELGGELMLIVYHWGENESTLRMFSVSELGEWKEIKDIGNRSIFIGFNNQSFVLDNASETQGCLPNHIYKTSFDDRSLLGCRYRVDAHNLTNATVKHFKAIPTEVTRNCSHSHPLWIQPTFD